MRRFLFFSLPLLVLTMAVFQFALEAFHQTIVPVGGPRLPGWVVLGTWFLEALGLCCLYLLIHAGGGGRWFNGLVTGWIAWIFRGPLLVISVTTLGGLSPGPWWSLTFRWWILYTGCGLLLAAVAGVAELSGEAARPAAPAASPPAVPPPSPFAAPPPVRQPRPSGDAPPRRWLTEPEPEDEPAEPVGRPAAAIEPSEDR